MVAGEAGQVGATATQAAGRADAGTATTPHPCSGEPHAQGPVVRWGFRGIFPLLTVFFTFSIHLFNNSVHKIR